jgi:hypothetical protein
MAWETSTKNYEESQGMKDAMTYPRNYKDPQIVPNELCILADPQ